MDLDRLAKVFSAEGPFVSLYVDTTSAVEDAATRLETRWKNIQRELEEQGVDEATREALSAARGDHGPGNTRVLIASHGQVHLATWLPEPPPVDVIRVGTLPHLMPLVESLSLRLSHVVVLSDRIGADVLAYTTGPDPVETATTGDAAPWPVHKTGVGGWSSKRYDATVENNWEQSAKEMASLVEKVATDVDARLLVACGDERAISLLPERLPAALQERYVAVPGGGRHADGSDEHVAEAITAALAAQAEKDAVDLLERFSEQRGRDELACEGPAAVVAALRMSQVDTLLLTDAFEDPATPAWFGPEPTHLALTEAELRDLRVPKIEGAPLVDVLLRAALGTAADVRLVTGSVEQAPSEGLGALLRFPSQSS